MFKIILRNVCTMFNLVNLILALMIISVGSYKNLLFVLIAIANTLIGIINEIRAKKTIDKLRLLSEQKPTVIRNGKIIQIPMEDIKKSDRLILSIGDQILVDATVDQGSIEVNESFITGEQDNIHKNKGDQLLSGSFVVSGSCEAIAKNTAEDSFVKKLEQSAKTIKTADSKLFKIMNNIVKYISIALIPIGALLLWSRFRVPDTTTEVAVTSSVLALATIRLSRQKVLVQDLYSIETLARVDCIALDKTGTLTTGKMAVHDYIPLEKSFESALASILTSQTADNATITALKKKFLKKGKFEEIKGITEVIDFSSERKHSGIKTKNATYLLGAVDFITDDKEIIKKVKSASGSYRTLAVVEITTELLSGSRSSGARQREEKRAVPVATGDGDAGRERIKVSRLLGYIRLEDELRHDAPDIIQYFYDNNIDIKIISGDDLRTVTEIAEKVGVKDCKGINLSDEKQIDYDKIVKNHNIFTYLT